MLEAIAPVLYFAPSIINQIQISNDNGLMVSNSNLKVQHQKKYKLVNNMMIYREQLRL